jgi:transposase
MKGKKETKKKTFFGAAEKRLMMTALRAIGAAHGTKNAFPLSNPRLCICRLFGISMATLERYIAQDRATGGTFEQSAPDGRGKKKKTSACDEKFLEDTVKALRLEKIPVTLDLLRERLVAHRRSEGDNDFSVTAATLSRTLKSMGFQFCRRSWQWTK